MTQSVTIERNTIVVSQKGRQGVGRSVGDWRYRYNADIDPGTIVAGEIRFNNADPSLATIVYVTDTDLDGRDNRIQLLELNADADIMVLSSENLAVGYVYDNTALATGQTGYVEVPIFIKVSYQTLADQAIVFFGRDRLGGGGGGGAPTNAEYLLNSANGFLPNAIVLPASTITQQGNTFNGISELIQTDGSGRYPALDGSQITNIPTGATQLDDLSDVTIGTPVATAIPTLRILGDLNTDGTYTVFDWSPPGSSAAPIGAEYIVATLDAGLTNERLLTPVTNQTTVDFGTSGQAIVGTVQDIDTSSTPEFFNLGITSGTNGQLFQKGAGTTVTYVDPTSSLVGLGNVPNVDCTNASNITTGTLADARLTANVTLQGNVFNGINQLVQTDGSGRYPALDGSQITNLPTGATQLNDLSDVTIGAPVATATATLRVLGDLNTDGTYTVFDWSPPSGGGGLTSAYVSFTDGINTSNATGGDTFRFRSSDISLINFVVTDNDVTFGDNLLADIQVSGFEDISRQTQLGGGFDPGLTGAIVNTDTVLIAFGKTENHRADTTIHVTSDQSDALDGANSPSAANVFITTNDISTVVTSTATTVDNELILGDLISRGVKNAGFDVSDVARLSLPNVFLQPQAIAPAIGPSLLNITSTDADASNFLLPGNGTVDQRAFLWQANAGTLTLTNTADNLTGGTTLLDIDHVTGRIRLGGNLLNRDNDIYVTDNADNIVAAIGKISTENAAFFTFIDPSLVYDPNYGGIVLRDGGVENHGASLKVEFLDNSGVDPIRNLVVTQDGYVSAAPLPTPGWVVTDTSMDTTSLGTGDTPGPWVKISDLTVNIPQDVEVGQRVDVALIIEIDNVIDDKSGSIDIGWGPDAGSVPTIFVNNPVSPDYSGPSIVSFFSTTHGGISSGAAYTAFVRRSTAEDSNFGINLRGDRSEHEFSVSSPAGGIGPNDILTEVGSLSDITGNVSLAGGADVNVPSGTAFINGQAVAFSAQTVTISNIAGRALSAIAIEPTGLASEFEILTPVESNPPSMFIDHAFVGFVLHNQGAGTLQSAIPASFIKGDFTYPLGVNSFRVPPVSGLFVAEISGGLTSEHAGYNIYSPGVNAALFFLSGGMVPPNSVSIPAASPLTFTVILQNGTIVGGPTTAYDPDNWDDGGTLTSLSGAQVGVLYSYGAEFFYQPGQFEYPGFPEAFDDLNNAVASMVKAFDVDAYMPVAAIVMVDGETEWGEEKAVIVNVGMTTIGGTSTRAYANITDGTNTALSTVGGTFQLRTNSPLSVVVTDNDPTFGDNALFSLNNVIFAAQQITPAGGTLELGRSIAVEQDHGYFNITADLTISTSGIISAVGIYSVRNASGSSWDITFPQTTNSGTVDNKFNVSSSLTWVGGTRVLTIADGEIVEIGWARYDTGAAERSTITLT